MPTACQIEGGLAIMAVGARPGALRGREHAKRAEHHARQDNSNLINHLETPRTCLQGELSGSLDG